MYCGHEIVCETVDEIIELAKAHAMAEHGVRVEQISRALIGVWRLHIHDTAAGGTAGIRPA